MNFILFLSISFANFSDSPTPNKAEDWFQSDSAGVKAQLPNQWTKETKDGILILTSPDKQVQMGFIVTQETEAETVMEVLSRELGRVAKDIAFKQTHEEFTLNELNAWSVDGTGTLGETPVNIALEAVFTPSHKILIVFAIGTQEQFDKHADEIDKSMGSVVKL